MAQPTGQQGQFPQNGQYFPQQSTYPNSSQPMASPYVSVPGASAQNVPTQPPYPSSVQQPVPTQPPSGQPLGQQAVPTQPPYGQHMAGHPSSAVEFSHPQSPPHPGQPLSGHYTSGPASPVPNSAAGVFQTPNSGQLNTASPPTSSRRLPTKKIKEGFLTNFKTGLKSTAKRWVVLDDLTITMFTSDGDPAFMAKAWQAWFPIKCITKLEVQNPGLNITVSMVNVPKAKPKMNHTYLLIADNPEEDQEWFDAINLAAKGRFGALPSGVAPIDSISPAAADHVRRLETELALSSQRERQLQQEVATSRHEAAVNEAALRSSLASTQLPPQQNVAVDLSQLQESLAMERQRNNDLTRQLEAAQNRQWEEARDRGVANSRAQSDLTEMHALVQDRDRLIAELQRENENLRSRDTRLVQDSARAARSERAVEELSRELNLSLAEVENLREQLSRVNDTSMGQQMQYDWDGLRLERDEWRLKADKAERDAKATATVVDSLRGQVDEAVAAAAAARRETSELRASLTAPDRNRTESALETANEEILILKKRLEHREGDIRTLQADIIEIIQEKNTTISLLRQQLKHSGHFSDSGGSLDATQVTPIRATTATPSSRLETPAGASFLQASGSQRSVPRSRKPNGYPLLVV